MTDTQTKLRRTPAPSRARLAARPAAAEFRDRFAARAMAAGLDEAALDPALYEGPEDADALIRHIGSAPVEPLGIRDIAGSRRRAKARKRTTVRSNAPKVRDAARKPRTERAAPSIRAVRLDPAGPGSGPTRTPPTMAQLVRPGLSLGPPKRFIGARIVTPEIDVADARFRRQRVGVGKCTGDRLVAVRRAYAFAFVMLESAKAEVRAIKRDAADARVLWHASMERDEAALSYWFGENYDHNRTMEMLHKVDDILSEWSMAFRGGFRDILPVFIRCKSVNGVGGGPARHVVKNTIELFPRYFDMPRAKQAITMLHEMGHRCKSLLKPRDERHDLCTGGWNSAENMCYRDNGEVADFGRMFRGGNPRILAEAATRGSGSARKTLLNNIDNYVCYMWNRYADHEEQTMFLLPEGAKQAKPQPTGKGKPVGKRAG